eukprot:Opistho-2@19370
MAGAYEYLQPMHEIFTPADVKSFLASEACDSLVAFVTRLGDSVIGKKITDAIVVSPTVQGMIDTLSCMDEYIKDIPPITDHKSRFGNPAFRTWLTKVQDTIDDHLRNLVPEEAIIEFRTYFTTCFGDFQRIDYGTGHELHFCVWMYCFEKIGKIGAEDYPALVLRVFNRYLKLMRNLQLTYWLEPAGSHGVWGLDDYHFLPFLFGAAQLVDHSHMRPKSIHNEETVAGFGNQYMYLGCIQFINQVKTGTLPWHSPLLNDISGAKTWRKVYDGMIKMYKAEVLSKRPIVQHLLFGSLFHFESDAVDGDDAEAGEDPCGQGHAHGGHGHGQAGLPKGSGGAIMTDVMPPCCAPRVPSAMSAMDSKQRKNMIPFD